MKRKAMPKKFIKKAPKDLREKAKRGIVQTKPTSNKRCDLKNNSKNEVKTKKRRTGRPSKFNDKMLERVYRLAMLGCSDEEIAFHLEIDVVTFYDWKKKKPLFAKALRKGKEEADELIVYSLYHRAQGYTHPEEKVFCNDGKIIRARVLKHYPPDTNALKFWLINRHPDKWKDRHHQEITGQSGGPIQVVGRGYPDDENENSN